MAFKLNSINSEVMLPIEGGSSHTLTLDSLPVELLGKIFYHLSAKDLQTIAPLNRKIFSVVIDSANRNEPLKIQKYISALFHLSPRWLNQVPEQPATALKEISQNVSTQNFESLRLLKEYNLGVKKQLINVMKTLNNRTLNDLEQRLHLPCFFENIYILTNLETLKRRANLNPNAPGRDHQLNAISESLAKAEAMDGNIQRAIEIAESIFSTSSRAAALKNVFTVLAQAGEMDRSLVVVSSISNEENKSIALGVISKAFAQAGNIDQALEIAGSISDHAGRRSAFKYIFAAMGQRGNIDTALEIANSIADDLSRGAALDAIATVCMQAGNFDRALEIANLIVDEHSLASALNSIATICAQRGNIEKVVDIFRSAPLDTVKFYISESIPDDLAQSNMIEVALEGAALISDDLIRGAALGIICIAVLRRGNIDRAVELAESIPVEQAKWDVLAAVYRFLMLVGNMERAAEIAQMIPRERLEQEVFIL